MKFHYLWFIWTTISLVSTWSVTGNIHIEACSAVGLNLQHCLVPNPKTPFSLDSCCTFLNQVVQAGYYCFCSVISLSNYPVITNELALSFSNCYLSLPPLTHCHVQVSEPHPDVTAPPLAALPQPNHHPPSSLPSNPFMPVLAPPEPPSRDDVTFVPLPPKVNETPLNSNSSTVDKNPNSLPTPPPLPPSTTLLPLPGPPTLPRDDTFVPLPPKVNENPLDLNSSIYENPSLSSNPLPELSIPERWDHVSSDGVDINMLLHSRNFLLVAILACIA